MEATQASKKQEIRKKNKYHKLSFLAIIVFIASQLLIGGPLTAFFSAEKKVEAASENWYGEGGIWLYRKPIAISNSGDESTDFQVKVEINSSNFDYSKAKADLADLRFTDSDKLTSLHYWVESCDASGTSVFWVKIPSLPASSVKVIYMYYGNSEASSASNGDQVFLFFDDFNADAAGDFSGNSKWNVYKEANTKIEVQNEYTNYGYYNGYDTAQGDGHYKIGAFVPDNSGLNSEKYHGNPVLAGGSGWEVMVKDPYILKVGDIYYLYYSGFNGTYYQIGLATSQDGIHFAEEAGNPVLRAGSGWEAGGVSFPVVYYDQGEANSAKKWKMLFGGAADALAGPWEIGYAYSADGISWTKYSGNPVLHRGLSGTWDDLAALTGDLVKNGDTYYLYYGGLNESTSKWQGGLATFADFEGSYTKSPSNPILQRRINATQNLTSQANSGSKIISVADTSVFSANEPVYINSADTGADNDEMNRIVSIDSPTQMTLQNNLARNYPTGSVISSFIHGSLMPRNVSYENGLWKMWGTGFQSYDADIHMRETSFYASSADGLNWSVSNSNSPLLGIMTLGSGEWDSTSTENPVLLKGVPQSNLGKAMSISSNSDSATVHLVSKENFSDFVMESKIKYGRQKSSWIDFRGQNFNQTNPEGYFALKQEDDHNLSQFDGGWTTGSSQSAAIRNDEYYRAIVTANGNSQNFRLDNYASGTNLVDRSASYSEYNSGFIGFSAWAGYGKKTETLLKWVFLRKYSASKPTLSLEAAQSRSDYINFYSEADLNNDNLINSIDFNILKSDFLKLTANLSNPRSDIDGDGRVTIKDVGIMMSGWSM
jgi:predicted GH43/DUF377 family glycosyl hydrolase